MTKRIVIMAGGTGGHVFPALAVAHYLREQNWQVTWLGTAKGLEQRVVPEQGFTLDYLSVAGLRGKGLFFKMKSVLLLLKACWQARRVLKQRRPDLVLGMGGFVAGPGGLMAKWLGIPLIIHEQNRVVGTTNRILARFAKRVCEAFPHSFSAKYQAICTGNPLRSAFNTVTTEKPAHDTLNILIIGGSQGAQILNETIPSAMALLAEKTALAIQHQTGSAMLAEIQQTYQQLGLNAEVFAFSDNIIESYQWADMVICRAGAMTVSEVSAMGLPAIFIPLANAIDDHQTANARYLTSAHAALLLPQQELTTERLLELIEQLIMNKSAMRTAALTCAKINATQHVAELCMQEAKA